MLVLTRRERERVVVADSIVIEVARIDGNRVRLAFAAPEDITIRRGELPAAGERRTLRGHNGELAAAAMRLYESANEGRRHLRDQLEELREENRRLLEELAAAEERLESQAEVGA